MKAEIHLDITLRDDNGEIIAHDTMNRIEPTHHLMTTIGECETLSFRWVFQKDERGIH